MDGYPHIHGAGHCALGAGPCQHETDCPHRTDCCCEACTGPDGQDCTPDVWGSQCIRCGRSAVVDDADTTATILEAIADRVASQADGQTSWLP